MSVNQLNDIDIQIAENLFEQLASGELSPNDGIVGSPMPCQLVPTEH
ncbi:MAG: hypothetical protein ABIG63_20535 [Chloroflexota bacterium]